MRSWFQAKCPVSDEDRCWIEHRFAWLVEQFGIDRMVQGPTVLPTTEFFPDPAEMKPEAMRKLLDRVCDYMQVDSKQIALGFYGSGESSGMYDGSRGTSTVWLEMRNTEDPVSIVATFAHEIGHHLLLGSGKVTSDTKDHEPLTDLLTVFFGFGIFTANSVIHENEWPSIRVI